MITILKRKSRFFVVVFCLISSALLACSLFISGVDSKMTVIVPKNYSGICIIGFSNTQKKSDSVTVVLDENGVGQIDGNFSDFDKSKNMSFIVRNSAHNQLLSDYLTVDKNRIDTSQIFIQHGLTVSVNDKIYLILRIGNAYFLNSEFNIDDPEINRKINSIRW